MKRKGIAALCLLAALALLSGCSGQQPAEVIPEFTQYLGPAATDTPTPEPTVETYPDELGGQSVFDQNPYDVGFTEDDALNEENLGSDLGDTGYVETTLYPYAGSTPIPLLPVDAPTPTPRPTLTFTYVPYTALGLSFEAPAGWVADESIGDMYILSEPEAQIKDGQLGVLTLSVVPVSSNYTESNLKSEVQQRLDTLGATNFSVWKPSLTATRYLLGAKGVYANYTGTLSNGVQVGGRIHCTCVDKTLYCVQITYPLGFKEDYLNVFSKARETIPRAK